MIGFCERFLNNDDRRGSGVWDSSGSVQGLDGVGKYMIGSTDKNGRPLTKPTTDRVFFVFFCVPFACWMLNLYQVERLLGCPKRLMGMDAFLRVGGGRS